MRNTATKKFAWLACRIFCVALSALAAQPFAEKPRIYLWAWDRAEDLRFLDADIGVAYFAGEIDLGVKKPEFKPRRKELLLAPGHQTLPVLHVRAHRAGRYEAREHQIILQAIRSLIQPRSVTALQLDFEVFHSQRDFYKTLIRAIQNENPNLKLSITALASWCGRDAWLKDIPVQEIVPMLFDPSHARNGEAHRLERDTLCRNSAGIATYETYHNFPRAKTYFIFHNRAWRREDVTRMQAILHENTR